MHFLALASRTNPPSGEGHTFASALVRIPARGTSHVGHLPSRWTVHCTMQSPHRMCPFLHCEAHPRENLALRYQHAGLGCRVDGVGFIPQTLNPKPGTLNNNNTNLKQQRPSCTRKMRVSPAR